ncbi:hypothetical protein Zmor_022065 [Zophobas morio]|uniref:Uncharacterized protein n=1 Tax=Zophobas morio TaxID=2755281 RepID=A0AA38I717_9CUCU|nr:hypothetical protein Zmor_022065 [Zophobas morio]
MCDDDDWDVPNNSTTTAGPKVGVISEGGCKFSAGRGFVPADRGDRFGGGDSWGDNNDNGKFIIVETYELRMRANLITCYISISDAFM